MEIGQDWASLGTVWVRCLVGAAQKISGTRLLVGLVSTRIKLSMPHGQQFLLCHEVWTGAINASSVANPGINSEHIRENLIASVRGGEEARYSVPDKDNWVPTIPGCWL